MTLEAWYPISDIPDTNPLTRHIAPPEHILPPPGYNYSPDGEVIDPWGRYFAVSDVLDDGTGYLWLGTWGTGSGGRRCLVAFYGNARVRPDSERSRYDL